MFPRSPAPEPVGAFERKLSSGPGRFDRWAHGETSALTRSEQRGAALFAGKGNCVPCHGGPFMSDQKFHVVGLKPRTVAVTFLDRHGLEVPWRLRGKEDR